MVPPPATRMVCNISNVMHRAFSKVEMAAKAELINAFRARGVARILAERCRMENPGVPASAAGQRRASLTVVNHRGRREEVRAAGCERHRSATIEHTDSVIKHKSRLLLVIARAAHRQGNRTISATECGGKRLAYCQSQAVRATELGRPRSGKVSGRLPSSKPVGISRNTASHHVADGTRK